jgi:uncharacterized membrane protein YedE/YeeE
MFFTAQRYFGYPWFFISSALILVLIFSLSHWKLQILLMLGLALGASLNYFVFGFTSAWRRFLLEGRSLGIRAQIVMLILASLLFAPLILLGQIGEQIYQGLVRPISLSVVVGAFLFGIGMQLAGACSSGTFNRVGQLVPVSFITFICLFIGGLTAAYFYGHWVNWPTFAPLSFLDLFSGLGLLVGLGLLGLVYWLLIKGEQQRHQSVESLYAKHNQAWLGFARHPLLIAGVLLALLNFSVFIISGQPWSLASVFTIWSIKFSEMMNLGLDWRFWDISLLYETRIERPLLDDPVSLTTIGVILGALLVTLYHGASSKAHGFSLSALSKGIIGGLLMGFGATLSYGCNIGAFFSGIASGSLHGWLWIIFAIIGNIVALKLIMKR